MRRTATCTFEARTKDCLQMIVIEQEDGFSKVIEIAEVHPGTAPDDTLEILTSFISRSGLPFDLNIRTFWSVDLAAAQNVNAAFTAIIDAYPGQGCEQSIDHTQIFATEELT